MADLVNGLLDALDPDQQEAKAQELCGVETPTPEQVQQAVHELVKAACAPFDNPDLRNLLVELKQRSEQVIDTVSQDTLLEAGFDDQAKEKARTLVGTFRQFIEDNKDELLALQILYNRPYDQRHLTYQAVKELAAAVQKPPYNLAPEAVWQAYERLERSKVRGAGPQKLLTDLVALVRFALQQSEVLEPFPLTVEERFRNWLVAQSEAGRQFSSKQVEWLRCIKDHIAANAGIEVEDFEYTPFFEMGGPGKIYQLFGDALNDVLNDLNKGLVG